MVVWSLPPRAATRATSALLTWTFVIVVPLCLVIVAAAGPIASLLNPHNPNAHCNHADVPSGSARAATRRAGMCLST